MLSLHPGMFENRPPLHAKTEPKPVPDPGPDAQITRSFPFSKSYKTQRDIDGGRELVTTMDNAYMQYLRCMYNIIFTMNTKQNKKEEEPNAFRIQ